jgi:hypothetical protein
MDGGSHIHLFSAHNAIADTALESVRYLVHTGTSQFVESTEDHVRKQITALVAYKLGLSYPAAVIEYLHIELDMTVHDFIIFSAQNRNLCSLEDVAKSARHGDVRSVPDARLFARENVLNSTV